MSRLRDACSRRGGAFPHRNPLPKAPPCLPIGIHGWLIHGITAFTAAPLPRERPSARDRVVQAQFIWVAGSLRVLFDTYKSRNARSPSIPSAVVDNNMTLKTGRLQRKLIQVGGKASRRCGRCIHCGCGSRHFPRQTTQRIAQKTGVENATKCHQCPGRDDAVADTNCPSRS